MQTEERCRIIGANNWISWVSSLKMILVIIYIKLPTQVYFLQSIVLNEQNMVL